MATLLELSPDTAHPVLTGAAEIEQVLDVMLAAVSGASVPFGAGACAGAVRALERIGRRVEAVKLKLLAAADKNGTAADAGFTGTEAWVARQTTASRTQAAREVAPATELETGAHDATATALDEGLLSPAHATVILRAGRDLPAGVSEEQRRVVEAVLVEQAQRFDPDQLRRVARRAIEAVEPDQVAIDAHENELVRTEEEVAREKARLTFHDNADGTVTGHFTIPTLAAAILRKVIDSMTAPRRMREPGDRIADRHRDRVFDWGHRRGLAFTELLEHLPTDRLHSGGSRRKSRGVTNEQEERSRGCSAWDASAHPPACAGAIRMGDCSECSVHRRGVVGPLSRTRAAAPRRSILSVRSTSYG